MNLVARGWQGTADWATVEATRRDITYKKGMAMTALAPDMGSYMNEVYFVSVFVFLFLISSYSTNMRSMQGDWQDPNYLVNYYGGALGQHEQAKRKYDPRGVFYCPTCVDSDDWTVSDGHLCRK